MAKVFVSYSRSDSKRIKRLIDILEEAGHQVWIDRAGIKGGEVWRHKIVNAINNSDVMVLVLSRHSIESDNVRKELDLAESEKILVIPVEIEAVTIPPDLRYQLVGVQHINLYADYSVGANELLNTLGEEQPVIQKPEKPKEKGLLKRPNYIWITLIFVGLLSSGIIYSAIQILSNPPPTPAPDTVRLMSTSLPEPTLTPNTPTVMTTTILKPPLQQPSQEDRVLQFRANGDRASLELEQKYWEKYEAGTSHSGLYLRSDTIEAFGDFLELNTDQTFIMEQDGVRTTGTWMIDGDRLVLIGP
jgi:hypothetical protein